MACKGVLKGPFLCTPPLTSHQIQASSGEGVLISSEATTFIKRQSVGRNSARGQRPGPAGSCEGVCLGPEPGQSHIAASATPWWRLLTEFCLIKSLTQRCKGEFLIGSDVRPFLQRHGPSPESLGFF